MIETVLFVALSLFCGAPEPLPTDYVADVIESGVKLDELWGSHPYDLPTAPSEDGTLSYRITVDPMYDTYKLCFYSQVKRILTDDRTWPNIREAAPGEVPQVWVILTPPAVCGYATPLVSCAPGHDGEGQIWMNYNGWMGGHQTEELFHYRAHVLNHEIGHHLLGGTHPSCAIHGSGVMVPTKRTSICDFLAWPTIQEKRASLK